MDRIRLVSFSHLHGRKTLNPRTCVALDAPEKQWRGQKSVGRVSQSCPSRVKQVFNGWRRWTTGDPLNGCAIQWRQLGMSIKSRVCEGVWGDHPPPLQLWFMVGPGTELPVWSGLVLIVCSKAMSSADGHEFGILFTIHWFYRWLCLW